MAKKQPDNATARVVAYAAGVASEDVRAPKAVRDGTVKRQTPLDHRAPKLKHALGVFRDREGFPTAEDAEFMMVSWYHGNAETFAKYSDRACFPLSALEAAVGASAAALLEELPVAEVKTRRKDPVYEFTGSVTYDTGGVQG